MAQSIYLDHLANGITDWNAWRDRHFDDYPDLSDADLSGINLAHANLRYANFRNACLTGATLTGADLTGADFTGAVLRQANLSGATLTQANFSQADLSEALLLNTKLDWADSRGTMFHHTRFTRYAKLSLHLETSLLSRGAIALDPT